MPLKGFCQINDTVYSPQLLDGDDWTEFSKLTSSIVDCLANDEFFLRFHNDSIYGKQIIIQFTILETGKISRITLLQGISKEVDMKIIRILEKIKMQKFEGCGPPRRRDGTPYAITCTQPIKIWVH